MDNHDSQGREGNRSSQSFRIFTSQQASLYRSASVTDPKKIVRQSVANVWVARQDARLMVHQVIAFVDHARASWASCDLGNQRQELRMSRALIRCRPRDLTDVTFFYHQPLSGLYQVEDCTYISV